MNKLDQKEMNFLNALGSMHGSPVPQAINPTGPSAFTKIISMNEDKPQLTKPEPIKSSNPNNPSDIRETKPNEEKLDKSETEIKKELEEAKIAEQIQAGSEKYEAAHGKVLDLEKVLSDVSSQKQDLENQILELRRKLDQQNQKYLHLPPQLPPADAISQENSKDSGKSYRASFCFRRTKSDNGNY